MGEGAKEPVTLEDVLDQKVPYHIGGNPGGKLFFFGGNSHIHATRIGWNLWKIDIRFAPELPPGGIDLGVSTDPHGKTKSLIFRPQIYLAIPEDSSVLCSLKPQSRYNNQHLGKVGKRRVVSPVRAGRCTELTLSGVLYLSVLHMPGIPLPYLRYAPLHNSGWFVRSL